MIKKWLCLCYDVSGRYFFKLALWRRVDAAKKERNGPKSSWSIMMLWKRCSGVLR